jgi:hypothetical protein
MTTEAQLVRVEVYNRCVGGRAVGNGYMVVRYTADGRRGAPLKVFGADEGAARAYAARLNGLEQGQGEH